MPSEYQRICQTMGPSTLAASDALLFMLDEPAGATEFVDTMRTSEMAALGFGTAISRSGAPTTHGGSLLPGSAALLDGGPTSTDFRCDTSSPYRGSYINCGNESIWRTTLDYNDSYSSFCVCKPPGSELIAVRAGAFLAKYGATGGDNGIVFGLRSATSGASYFPFLYLSTPAGASKIYAGMTAQNMASGSSPWFVGVRHTYLGGTHTIDFFTAPLSASSLTKTSATYLFGTAATNVTATLFNSGSGDAYDAPLCIGSYSPSSGSAADDYNGLLSGLAIVPRAMPDEMFEAQFQAAKAAASERVLGKNLGVIKRAMLGNCMGRLIGDSTGEFVGDDITKVLSNYSLIPRRMGHFKVEPLTRNTSYLATAETIYGIDGAPSAEFAVASGGPVPTKRGYSLTTYTHNASEPADNDLLGTSNDNFVDVMSATVFPEISARLLYPVTQEPGVVDDLKFRITNSAGTTTSAAIPMAGSNAEFAASDLGLSQDSTGNIVTTIRGTSNTQASLKFAHYGLLYVNSKDILNPTKTGWWWTGYTRKNGARSTDHADDTLYPMSQISAFLAAMFGFGMSVSFTDKLLVTFLTINDAGVSSGAGETSEIMNDAFDAIEERWSGIGFTKFLHVQPWLPYGNSTLGSYRLPLAWFDRTWEEVYLPRAKGNVGVVSLHQYYRMSPLQYLENSSNPTASYSVHTTSTTGTLAMLTPLGIILRDAALPGGDFRSGSRSRGRPMISIR